MPAKLRLFLILFLLPLFLTGCNEEKKVTVKHYHISNVEEYADLMSEAPLESESIARIPLDEEVKILNDTVCLNWLHVETKNGKRGFLQEKYLTYTKEAIIIPPLTAAQKLEKANQWCSPLFKYLEELTAKYDTDRSRRTWGLTIAALLAWGLAIATVLGFKDKFHWWPYIVLLVASPVIGIVMATVEPLAPSGFDNFLIDLLVLILLVSSPIAYLFTMFGTLLFASNESYTFTIPHLAISIVSIFAFVICAYLFQSAADTTLIIFLCIQALAFFVLLAICIKTNSYRSLWLYPLTFIVSFATFTLIFIQAAILISILVLIGLIIAAIISFHNFMSNHTIILFGNRGLTPLDLVYKDGLFKGRSVFGNDKYRQSSSDKSKWTKD